MSVLVEVFRCKACMILLSGIYESKKMHESRDGQEISELSLVASHGLCNQLLSGEK